MILLLIPTYKFTKLRSDHPAPAPAPAPGHKHNIQTKYNLHCPSSSSNSLVPSFSPFISITTTTTTTTTTNSLLYSFISLLLLHNRRIAWTYHSSPMYSHPSFFVFLFHLSIFFPIFSCFPDPDPVTIEPLLVNPSPPATIPAFPEQSNVAGCPLDLPDELFHAVESACGSATKNNKEEVSGQLRRSRCCPVLATWLYSAYSATALGSAGRVTPAVPGHNPTSVDLPLLPDDSETCVDDLGKALKRRGIALARPNETCDVVYCFCGIRLHPLSCPESFSLNQRGKLVGNENVKRLEKDCLSSSTNVNGFPGLGGCNKCLNSLSQVKLFFN